MTRPLHWSFWWTDSEGLDEWRRLSHSDLESSVNEQLAHLVAHMHEAHLAAQEAAKAISSDLKSLETVSYTHLTLPTIYSV